MITIAMPAMPIGMTIFQRIVKKPAPSIRALSMTSFGIPTNELRISSTAPGMPAAQ